MELNRILKKLLNNLPKFPDGRIDYSNSNVAPVLNCTVKFKDKLLILKRSDKVGAYKRKWCSIAGYIDDLKPINEKVLEELKEEAGISKNIISLIKIGENYKYTDIILNKTWIVYPVLVKLKEKPKIKLDWEHTEFKCINPKNLIYFDTVLNLNISIEKALKSTEY